MSRRLDQEREKELQPKRYDYAKQKFEELGYEVHEHGTGKAAMWITFKGSIVYFWPYSGWHTGKTIKDGRGLKNLLKQINGSN